MQVDTLGSALGGHAKNAGFVNTAGAIVVESVAGVGEKDTDIGTGMVG